MASREPDPQGPRLLVIGDIHLGRRPSRLAPERLDELGLVARDLGPAAALASSVSFAIEQRVDAVLLAGDVVEDDEHFLEAYAPLRDGARRLVEHGIALIAVVGNHDTKVLPRLAQDVRGVHLLGAGGRWESALVHRGDVPVARILGWSFPERRHTSSPLDNFPAAWAAGAFDDGVRTPIATLGLLHCDVDASASHHAPVRRAALAELNLPFALGHVHKPDALDGPAPLGYLGSLCGLDPGEPGRRGPWLFEAEQKGWRTRHIPLAPVRYDVLDVDVSSAQSAEDVESRFLATVEAHAADLDRDGDSARAVVVRAVLIGRRVLDALGIAAALARLAAWRGAHFGARAYLLDTVRDGSRLALDLSALAQGDDPLGLLARRVLDLEQRTEQGRMLMARARARLGMALEDERRQAFAALDEDGLAALLSCEAHAALEELDSQRSRTP